MPILFVLWLTSDSTVPAVVLAKRGVASEPFTVKCGLHCLRSCRRGRLAVTSLATSECRALRFCRRRFPRSFSLLSVVQGVIRGTLFSFCVKRVFPVLRKLHSKRLRPRTGPLLSEDSIAERDWFANRLTVTLVKSREARQHDVPSTVPLRDSGKLLFDPTWLCGLVSFKSYEVAC